jgi:hypothetical protein
MSVPLSPEEAHDNAVQILRTAMVQGGCSEEDAEKASKLLVDHAEKNG